MFVFYMRECVLLVIIYIYIIFGSCIKNCNGVYNNVLFFFLFWIFFFWELLIILLLVILLLFFILFNFKWYCLLFMLMFIVMLENMVEGFGLLWMNIVEFRDRVCVECVESVFS